MVECSDDLLTFIVNFEMVNWEWNEVIEKTFSNMTISVLFNFQGYHTPIRKKFNEFAL